MRELRVFAEDELLPISALQHLQFCPRQCALIHVERLWVDNRLTVEGGLLHKRAHGERSGPRGGGSRESRAHVRIVRALPLRCFRLGLCGVADVVEFAVTAQPAQATGLHGVTPCSGVPFPIEYKRGRPKHFDWDRVQVCAQALCLEEMLGCAVPRGAIFYGRTRRREPVEFDAALRAVTENTAAALHQLIRSGRTPPAIYEKKCRSCSLIEICLPRATGGARSAEAYLARAVEAEHRMDDTTLDDR